MKMLLVSILMMAGAAQANVCYVNDVAYPNGAVRTFYYLANARQMGPNYDCPSLSRGRTCENGQWSTKAATCSQYDSGGCVDNWVDMMNDDSFTHATCID